MGEESRKVRRRNEIMKEKAGKRPGVRGTLSTEAGGEDGGGSREQREGGLRKQRRAEDQHEHGTSALQLQGPGFCQQPG